MIRDPKETIVLAVVLQIAPASGAYKDPALYAFEMTC